MNGYWKKVLQLCLAMGLVGPMSAQLDSVAMKYASTITAEELSQHLGILASDAYEGRETGMRGQKLAMEYLQKQFMAYGIPPIPNGADHGVVNGYVQPFAVELMRMGGITVNVDGTDHRFMDDFFYLNERMTSALTTQQVVYMGNGRKTATNKVGSETPMDPYKGIDAKGRTVLILDVASASSKGAVPGNDLYKELGRRAEEARNAGASVLLIASENAADMMVGYEHYLSSPRMRLVGNDEAPKPGIQTIIIDQQMARRILEHGKMNWKRAQRWVNRPGRVFNCPITYNYTSLRQMLQGENVLAFVEGSDKKEEVVVITAHYDHIGKEGREVYNGADDDGSGTVALLEIAQAFMRAKTEGHGPRRSILIMPVSGEEKGLLGSEYYSEHPVFPLANTVCDLNIDMIGRVDTAHLNSEHYVYAIGSEMLSSELKTINERMNEQYTHLTLDYTFDAPDDPNRFYYRSDHYNFAKNGVPVIFYFNGVHEDYHQATDEVDKIRFDLLRDRARLVFHTAWEVANREQRLMVDGKTD